MPEVTINEVWIVPCGIRPDKERLSNPKIRLEMTKLAVQDFFPQEGQLVCPLVIDEIEIGDGN
jgi:hypothetical protein